MNDSATTASDSLPRPSSLLMGPSSQMSAPTSLLSNVLPTSLLHDEANGQSASFSNISARPRRLWNIQDTSLRSIPTYYPPLNPNCTTYVGDSSPSVVAVRISECFRKRSIAVEYDDEAVSATAMTVDRCQFQVFLWRGKVTKEVDFSHGVVVECVRLNGSPISFYPACRAILQAALGQSTGDDDRPLRCINGLEFPRLCNPENNPKTSVDATPSPVGVSAGRGLEKARELLRKDRLDTQLLGMQRLVDLTTPSISGKEISMYASLKIVHEDPTWLLDEICVEEDGSLEDSAQTMNAAQMDSRITHSTIGPAVTPDEGRHESKMRAFALRVLCNALSNLADKNMLQKVLKEKPNHPLLDLPFLNTLARDLKGANRPLSIVQGGTKLASVHEAAMAVRMLRLLGEQDDGVKRFLESEDVLERLELARVCGRASHLVLQQEAERTYNKLTEDVRSC